MLAWRRWQEAMVGARNTPPRRKDGGRLFDLHRKHTRDGELGLVHTEQEKRRVLRNLSLPVALRQ